MREDKYCKDQPSNRNHGQTADVCHEVVKLFDMPAHELEKNQNLISQPKIREISHQNLLPHVPLATGSNFQVAEMGLVHSNSRFLDVMSIFITATESEKSSCTPSPSSNTKWAPRCSQDGSTREAKQPTFIALEVGLEAGLPGLMGESVHEVYRSSPPEPENPSNSRRLQCHTDFPIEEDVDNPPGLEQSPPAQPTPSRKDSPTTGQLKGWYQPPVAEVPDSLVPMNWRRSRRKSQSKSKSKSSRSRHGSADTDFLGPAAQYQPAVRKVHRSQSCQEERAGVYRSKSCDGDQKGHSWRSGWGWRSRERSRGKSDTRIQPPPPQGTRTNRARSFSHTHSRRERRSPSRSTQSSANQSRRGRGHLSRPLPLKIEIPQWPVRKNSKDHSPRAVIPVSEADSP
eukprot:g57231.t1